MTKKYVTKITTEFIYDKEGRITKEVRTEENYEEEIITKVTIKTEPFDIFKKSTGVPNTVNTPYAPQITYTSNSTNTNSDIASGKLKADTSSINVNTSVSNKFPKGHPDVSMDAVKRALEKDILKSFHGLKLQ